MGQARRAAAGPAPPGPEGWARVSPDGRYRYLLGRRWGSGASMLWVLANPSTADARTDDPTLRRCTAFAAAHGCGSLLVTNLWAWRATDPRELARAEDPVGPENDAAITEALAACTGPVVVGWGSRAERGRVEVVLGLLRGRPLLCLGTTRDAHPRHPLYVPGTTRLRTW